ncbi:MAG: hypothetical protein KAR76_01230 [Methanosarcinales archaeon]|nr:hypothetical protein [Methanosarcinales archaeon]
MRTTIVSLLAITAILLLVYNVTLPTHLHANLEMQHCGGCHTEDAVMHMHEYADPLEKECIECHVEAVTGLSVHAEMVPEECDRCHQFGDQPTYSDCDLCHHDHYHIEGGIETGDRPCVECHKSHSLITDRSCAKCHREEYNLLKTLGDKHSERPDSCYNCHSDHKYIPDCLDCHEEMFHGEELLHNCSECHHQHMPKELYFSPLIVPEECGKCHPDVIQEFQEHPSKHSGIDCVECHQKHLRWRPCMDCHEGAHPEFTDFNVDKCVGCHRDSHSPAKYSFEKDWVS